MVSRRVKLSRALTASSSFQIKYQVEELPLSQNRMADVVFEVEVQVPPGQDPVAVKAKPNIQSVWYQGRELPPRESDLDEAANFFWSSVQYLPKFQEQLDLEHQSKQPFQDRFRFNG